MKATDGYDVRTTYHRLKRNWAKMGQLGGQITDVRL